MLSARLAQLARDAAQVLRSALPGRPRLRWPGDAKDCDVINLNDGLRFFAPGVQLLIRNTATHGTDDLGEQDAIDRLATLSLLARYVEACDLVDVS